MVFYSVGMKKDSFLTRFLFPVLAASVVFSAPIHAEEEETPLEKTMEQTSRALKSLRKIDKSDWAAGAEAARKAADGIRQGMAYEPAIAKDITDAKEKAKAIADYRRLMGESYATLCELEMAYLEEDQEKVDAVTKKVKAGRKEGHKKYTDD